MKSKNCLKCGCVNWETATHCIKCKTDFSQPQSEIEVKPMVQDSINSYVPNSYDSGFNIIGLFKVVLILGAISIIGFIYSNYYSYDKLTQISSFNQYYYGIFPPTENELKAEIIKSNSGKVSKTVKSSGQLTLSQCPGNQVFVPGSSSGFNCTPSTDLTNKYSKQVVESIPNIISFEINSSNLVMEEKGQLIYRAEYSAMTKGETFSDPFVVEEPIKPGTVSQAILIKGVIILNWNETEKKWSRNDSTKLTNLPPK